MSLLASPGAQSAPRYIVTASPLQMLGNARGTCLAVSADEPRRVWWWDPGATGCDSRSSSVVPKPDAALKTVREGVLQIHLRFERTTGSAPKEIDLTLNANEFRIQATGTRVAVASRHDLDMPLKPRGAAERRSRTRS